MAQENRSVVVVDNVSKQFVLPHEKQGSLKQMFTGVFRSKDKGSEQQQALKDVSFDVKKGEFFGILGRNGSGKSTMLKMLAGIYQPTEGQINVEGKLVPFIELGVGFNPELTGRENVYLNGALLGFSRDEITAMYDDIVNFAELEKFMDQKLKNYSSGMQVRLAFSVATRAQADVLLIDEVLAVGDADFQRKCFDYFRKLKATNVTVIFVTHDMNAVREYCDRAVLIEKSEVVEIGVASRIASLYTKMFIEQESSNPDAAISDTRWGTKVATISDLGVDKKRYSDGDQNIELSYTVTAHEAVADPVVGYMVKTATEQHLFGGNNLLLNQKMKPLKKGESRKITWVLPNIFNTGTHVIEPAIVYKNTMEVAEWWEDAISFDVFKERQTPYLLNPETEVRIETLS